MTKYIIDFSTFLYRFKSVYKWARVERNGVSIDTSALVGSIRSLKSNIFDDIIIVLDGFPSRSTRILPSYKGTRVKDDTFTSVGIPKLEVIQFLTQLGPLIHKNISVVCSPLQETDEVISSLVHHITGNLPPRHMFISTLNQRSIDDDKMLSYLTPGCVSSLYVPDGDRCIISTTDGDFIQLQRFEGVYIDESTSGKKITNQWRSASTHNLSPEATIIYKAIYGDVGDNIPPICKPDKEILSLIQRIDSIDKVYKIHQAMQTPERRCEDHYGALLVEMIKHARMSFLTNFDVAFLKFVSYPIKLSYPDYRIEDTISKYNLKV